MRMVGSCKGRLGCESGWSGSRAEERGDDELGLGVCVVVEDVPV